MMRRNVSSWRRVAEWGSRVRLDSEGGDGCRGRISNERVSGWTSDRMGRGGELSAAPGY